MVKLVEVEMEDDSVRNAMPHTIPHESHLSQMKDNYTRLLVIFITPSTHNPRSTTIDPQPPRPTTLSTHNPLDC